MYRVISLRYAWPNNITGPFCYIGQAWERLEGHPLANPFDRKDPDSLHKYLDWFNSLSNLNELLCDVRADSECGRLPLACWCGFWNPGQPSIRCHGLLIAKRLAEMFPNDMQRSDW